MEGVLDEKVEGVPDEEVEDAPNEEVKGAPDKKVEAAPDKDKRVDTRNNLPLQVCIKLPQTKAVYSNMNISSVLILSKIQQTRVHKKIIFCFTSQFKAIYSIFSRF